MGHVNTRSADGNRVVVVKLCWAKQELPKVYFCTPFRKQSPMPMTSSMSPQEFRALRESTGCSPRAWASLLHCSEGAVRNMESHKPIGKQMARLAIVLAHPMVRALLPEICAHKEKILHPGHTFP